MNHSLILDQIRLPGLTDTLIQLAPDAEPVYLYDTTRYAPLKAQSPLLVPCDINDDLYQHWKSNALWQSSGVLISWKGASQDTVIDHLRSLLWVNTPYDGPVLFRYYSPRLIHCWAPSLTDKERVAFLGPLTQLHTLTGDGRGQAHVASEAPWFTLSEPQMQAIDAMSHSTNHKETADV